MKILVSLILILYTFGYINGASPYNYTEALRLSFLFFEAQRSGPLPSNNRIPWRGDSALDDKGLNGEDLSGGYYDASDYVKFSFTTAFATTILAWGVLSYKDAYIQTGQYENALEAIKWSSDYFIKCHVSPNELYGQVGDFDIDHLFWGRPEDFNMSRPAYKIDTKHPGSELAGETSAALAATSLVFQNIDKEYSKLCLNHSIELFDFAVNYKGFYNDPIPGGQKYYESKNYTDELTWASIWIFKASNDSQYLLKALDFYSEYGLNIRPDEFYYNNKIAGIQVLLGKLTLDTKFIDAAKSFCDFSIFHQKKTPKGLIYIDKFGTLSHAANIGLICLQAVNLSLPEKEYVNFAKMQINYILGDTGKSFLIGFGKKYPLYPHHAASSCPDMPAPCNWMNYFTKLPNPQILFGALISGPDENDYYKDQRDEYIYTEVSIDYNAGFTSLLAGLIQKKIY